MTLVHIRPVLFIVVLLRLIDGFRLFEQIQVLTTGGPGIASTPFEPADLQHRPALPTGSVTPPRWAWSWSLLVALTVGSPSWSCPGEVRQEDETSTRTGILALRILLLLIGLVLIGIPFLWILLTAFK